MIDITVDVRDARWKKAVRTYRKTIQDVCDAVCAEQKIRRGELAVVLADDAFVQSLNHMYRGKNKPTNVLSFAGEGESLGDVVLAFETVAAEAAAQEKPIRHHLMHLVAHGMLHLFGYDHEREADAQKMEKLEIKILAKLRVKNPYLSFNG